MRRFEFLSHTADAKMKIEGDTLEELFTAGMEGMFELAKKGACAGLAEFSVSETIKISSADITSLLVDFLSELLTLSQEKKVVFCRVKFLNFETNKPMPALKAEVFGISVDSFDEDIKAVTYHEAEVKKNPTTGLYETNIVFDI